MNKYLKILISLFIAFSIGTRFNQAHAITYHGVHNVKFVPDASGRYGPAADNGKGAALDTDGKPGVSKAKAEIINNGGSIKSSSKYQHAINYHHTSSPSTRSYNNNDYSPSFKLPHLRTKHEIIKHKRNVIKHKRLAAQHAKSLRIIHAGLIWTGIVLVGALLIYYLTSKRKPRQVIKKP